MKLSSYSQYDVEACNEWRGPIGPSPRLSARETQLRKKNVATAASRWRHCADLDSPRIGPKKFRTNSDVLSTARTGRFDFHLKLFKWRCTCIISFDVYHQVLFFESQSIICSTQFYI